MNRYTMNKTILLAAIIMLTCCTPKNEVEAQTTMNEKLYITIGEQTVSATLVDNSATQALVERLQNGDVSLTLNSSGGFEIWGALGFSLPTSNQQITAQPGDIILYNGSNICLFYGSNSWSYTRLGKIDGLSESELRTFLKAGERNINVTLSLTPGTSAIKSTNGNRQEEGVYYSLNGQKLRVTDGSSEMKANSLSKGIYVKNGKKVVIR